MRTDVVAEAALVGHFIIIVASGEAMVSREKVIQLGQRAVIVTVGLTQRLMCSDTREYNGSSRENLHQISFSFSRFGEEEAYQSPGNKKI